MSLSFIKLLKTHVEKMSTFRLAKMSLKIKGLKSFCQDVDENKTERRWTQGEAKSAHRFSDWWSPMDSIGVRKSDI
jgi:hypothetical protein